MSKKIETVYTADPSAGNDPSKNYKIAGDDSGSPVALDMNQLAMAVAVRIGADPPPNPVEDLSQLVITIQDNTQVANIQSITGVAYTHYVVLSDDDTEPTYPDDFTEGPVPSLYTLSSWSAETLYVWVYDFPTTTKKELLDINGDSGITATPNYTIAPPQVDDLVIALDVTFPTTLVSVTFSAITPVASTVDHYELYSEGDGKLQNISTGTTHDIGPFTPGDTISLRIDTIMADGRNSEGIPVTQQMGSSSIPGTIGIKATTVRASNAGGYEATENAGVTPLTVTLERTLGTSGAISCTVSTVDKTALAATNYTAKSSETVSWGDGVSTDQDVDITLADNNEDTNLCFQLFIDVDSQTSGVIVDETQYTWGYGNSVLCYINGTGVASGEIAQLTDAQEANNRTAIEAEDYTSKTTVGADTWTLVTGPAGVLSTTGAMQGSSTDYRNGTNDNYTNGTGPIKTFNFVSDAVETNYAWVRLYGDTSITDSCYVDIDGTDYGDIRASSQQEWVWMYIGSFSGTTNPQAIRIKQREPETYIDIIAVTTEDTGTFNPNSISEAWVTAGNNPATPGTGVAVDDTSNPAFPAPPTISDVTSGDYTLSPVDGAAGIAVNGANFTCTFDAGFFELTNPVFTFIKDSDSSVVSGTTTDTESSATFIQLPEVSLGSLTAYTLTLSADYIKDSGGIRRGVNITGWNITTADTTPVTGDYVYDPDGLEAYANGTQYTTSIAAIVMKRWRSGSTSRDTATAIVNDPSPNYSRKVVRTFHRANQAYSPCNDINSFYSASNHITVPYAGDLDDRTLPIWDITGGPPDTSAFSSMNTTRGAGGFSEVWLVYEFRLSDPWDYDFAWKSPGMATGTPTQLSHAGKTPTDAIPEGFYGVATRMQLHGGDAFPRMGEGWLAFYEYNDEDVQKSRSLLLSGGDSASSNYNPIHMDPSNAYRPSKGKWIKVKQHIKLNTVGVACGSLPSIDGSPKESEYATSSAKASDGTLNDSEIDIWIREEGWAASVKMCTLRNRAHRWHGCFKLDEISWPYGYVNNQGHIHDIDQFVWWTLPLISGSDIDIG